MGWRSFMPGTAPGISITGGTLSDHGGGAMRTPQSVDGPGGLT